MNAPMFKCCFCNSVFDHNTERIPLILRADSILLKKFSLICIECKSVNVGAQLLQFKESVDAVSRCLEQLKTDYNSNCDRIFNVECKLGLLCSNLEFIASTTEKIEESNNNTTKSIALNNLGHDRFHTKVSKFINDFDSTVNEAINNKLDLIVSELKINKSQINKINQHISDNTSQRNSNSDNINQHLQSTSNAVSRLCSKFDEFSSNIDVTEMNKETDLIRIHSSLEKELKATRDSCNDLVNSISTIKPNTSTVVPNSLSLQQELLPDIAHSIINLATPSSPVIADVNIASNGTQSDNNLAHPTSLRVAPRPKDIFISRLNVSTTQLDVLSHVKATLALHNFVDHHNSIICKKISRFNGHVASFKITVPAPMFNLLMSPASWPNLTYIQEFVDTRTERPCNNYNHPNTVPKNLSACPSTIRM